MTVKELICILQQHDAESLVFVNGYEGGACRVLGVHAVTVALNTHKEWYYGAHSIVKQDGTHVSDATNLTTVTGLLLQGEQNNSE
jgi:hypothetical protein